MSKHQFIWFDLETTGLDESEGLILEWAAVLAEDDKDGGMAVVDVHEAVVSYEGLDRETLLSLMDPFVQNMHTKNGLIDAVLAGTGMSVEDSDEYLYTLAESLAGPKPKGIELAGGSVHFDLRWVKAHFPRFAATLSHRVFDVPTLKRAERTWGQEFPEIKGEDHRAYSDVKASIAEARAWRAIRY